VLYLEIFVYSNHFPTLPFKTDIVVGNSPRTIVTLFCYSDEVLIYLWIREGEIDLDLLLVKIEGSYVYCKIEMSAPLVDCDSVLWYADFSIFGLRGMILVE
jgi:hypothetical protein